MRAEPCNIHARQPFKQPKTATIIAAATGQALFRGSLAMFSIAAIAYAFEADAKDKNSN
jgi:hypothetical protein